MHPAVTFDPEKLAAVCRKYHVRVVEAFGSAVRDDFDPDSSDVDLLVLFDREKRRAWLAEHGGLASLRLHDEMEEVFGRPCDVVNIDAVENPYFLHQAMKHREPLYAA